MNVRGATTGGLALLLAGAHFAPWAWHKTAALTQSAHDLAISTHFTPGAGIFANQWFYVPLWVGAAIVALNLPARAALPRIMLTLIALGIAQFGLPEYPKYFEPQNLFQLIATVLVCAGVTIISFIRISLPMSSWKAITTCFLVGAAAIPLAGYLAIRPAITELYRDFVGIGAGWWLTALACLASLALQLGSLKRRQTEYPSAEPKR